MGAAARRTAQAADRPRGYLDYLTWQSRTLRLHPEDDGRPNRRSPRVLRTGAKAGNAAPASTIHGCVSSGRQRRRRSGRCGSTNTVTFGGTAPHCFSSAKRTRFDGSDDAAHALTAFELMEVLPRSARYRLSMFGLCTDKAAKVNFWRHETLPLPLAYLDRPELVESLKHRVGRLPKSVARDAAATSVMGCGRELADREPRDRSRTPTASATWSIPSRPTASIGRAWNGRSASCSSPSLPRSADLSALCRAAGTGTLSTPPQRAPSTSRSAAIDSGRDLKAVERWPWLAVFPAEEDSQRQPHPRSGERRCRVSERRWDEELVERLTELAKPENPNRAALAHLRRGLQAPLDYTLGRVGWLFRRVPELRSRRTPVLAAGLFAWVKGDCPQTREGELRRGLRSRADAGREAAAREAIHRPARHGRRGTAVQAPPSHHADRPRRRRPRLGAAHPAPRPLGPP